MFDLHIPRRVMTLFLLIDSSGSMSINGNMGKVNGAIEEMIPLLRDISDEHSDAEIKLAVLEFSSGCQWATGDNGPMSLDDFDWNDMAAGGLTDMGAAFRVLESKLSRDAFMNNAAGNFAPVIILLSDGEPTDDYVSGLKILQHNNWFRNAVKVAISVEGAASDVLAEFTGNIETVLKYDGEKSDLKKLLTRLAVVSSSIQSRSKASDVVDDRTEKPAEPADNTTTAEDTAAEDTAVAETDITNTEESAKVAAEIVKIVKEDTEQAPQKKSIWNIEW